MRDIVDVAADLATREQPRANFSVVERTTIGHDLFDHWLLL